MGHTAAGVVGRRPLLEDHDIGRDRCWARAAHHEQPRLLGERMHARIAEAAPERLIRRRVAGTVGEEPLVNHSDLLLVGGRRRVAVGVEHVAGVAGVGVPP